MRSCRGGAATVADDEGSATTGPCANPSVAYDCGQRRAMVLDQEKERRAMENIKSVHCKECQAGNLGPNQSFTAGESWVGGAVGIQRRANLLFVEVPRYLRTLWLAFYFLQQPQHFRSQTKQTLAVEDNAHQHATIIPTATSSYGTSTRMGYLCAALSEVTCTCRLAAATLLRSRACQVAS